MTRLACVAKDAPPRDVPIAATWNGSHIVTGPDDVQARHWSNSVVPSGTSVWTSTGSPGVVRLRSVALLGVDLRIGIGTSWTVAATAPGGVLSVSPETPPSGHTAGTSGPSPPEPSRYP